MIKIFLLVLMVFPAMTVDGETGIPSAVTGAGQKMDFFSASFPGPGQDVKDMPGKEVSADLIRYLLLSEECAVKKVDLPFGNREIAASV